MVLAMTRPTRDARGVYEIRRRVPPELQSILKKKTWKRSLSTRDDQEAKRRAVAVLQECNDAFALAESIYEGSVKLDAGDARQLAVRWFQSELEQLDSVGDYHRFVHTTNDGDVDADTGQPIGEVTDTIQSVMPSDTLAERVRATAPFVREMLAEHRLPPVPENSLLEAQLAEAFWVHLCELSKICLLKLETPGRYVPPPQTEPIALLSYEKRDRKTASLTLLDVYAKWAEDKRLSSRNERSVEKTIKGFGTTIDQFVELHTNLPVSSISKQVVQDFRINLARMAAVQGNHGLTARQLIEKADGGGVKTLSDATVITRLGALSAVLGFAQEVLGLITENPVVNIRQRANRERTPVRVIGENSYTKDELRQIFSSPLFHGQWAPPVADFGQALYWLPILMVYTGARREELAQLHVTDVKNEDGVTYFHLQEAGDQSLKTKGSWRKVPLHPDVIELGFLRYKDTLPASGRLFPKLTRHANGYGHLVGSTWARYLKNVARVNSTAKPNHGFRHTFVTLCRESGIPSEVQYWITGHSPGNVGGTYGHLPLGRMAAELNKFPSIARMAGLLPPLPSED